MRRASGRSSQFTAGMILALAIVSTLSPTSRAADEALHFTSVAALHDFAADGQAATGADSLPAGAISVEGYLVADFFRDVYLADPGQGPGLRVRTGEHLAELGQYLRWTGRLERDGRDGGVLVLDARGPEAAMRLLPAPAELPAAQALPLGALLAEPDNYRARLVDLNDLVVTSLKRDANDVAWLLIAEAMADEVSVRLNEGQHPALWEGDSLLAVRGIWDRDGDYWQLRPRSTDDWLVLETGQERGTRPPERRCVSKVDDLYRTGPAGSGFVGKRPQARPLLDEICYDPAQRGEGEGSESWAVVNDGDRRLKLDGWSLTDNEGQWFFPRGAVLRAGEKLYVARDDERFFFEFGFMPDFNFDDHPSPGDSALILDNGGDELLLLDRHGRVADAVVWEQGWSDAQPCWEGPGIEPYRFNDYVPAEGQVFWRKRSLRSGHRLDRGSAADWICDPDDPLLGRNLAFPGWDRERFLDTAACAETATVEAFVSPDNSFVGLRDFLRSARRSLDLSFYLFTHPLLADELLAALDRGVKVTVLLDGEVFGAQGGTYDVVRAIARSINDHASGRGHVYFWRSGDDPRHLGPDADMPDRYNHTHQKFIIADDVRVLVGSDNLTQSSLPADDSENGTNGSRGAFLVTDAGCVVARARAVWDADFDPRSQRDIRRYVPREGLAERAPRPGDDRRGYTPVQAEPYRAREQASFELSQSPDNALRPDRGYLGLVHRAGRGDWILVQQQYERAHWGYGDRQTPNPRLEAYIAAARRGARVRILLSGAGGNQRWSRSRKNVHTWERINALAADEGLDLAVLLGRLPGERPSRDRPIHNKMLLASLGRERWSHVGSANGSETAHRYNRELGLSIESVGLFDYLAAVFRADWERALADEQPDGEGSSAALTGLAARSALPEEW